MDTHSDETYLWKTATTTFSVLNAVLETPISMSDLCAIPDGVKGQLRKMITPVPDKISKIVSKPPLKRKGYFVEVNERAFSRPRV